MASSVDAPVRAGYWYCHSEFPIPMASIPSQLFTHIFAASADVNPHTYEVTFPEKYKDQFSTFTQTVQRKNENVKTLLSIGGDYTSDPATTLASMVSHRNTRKSFIDSSISVARSNIFHGLSLNWIYPSTASDMINLGCLLNEWRAVVKKESEWSGMDQLLLVVAVNFEPTYRSLSYPVDAISRNLDWINVWAFDFGVYTPDLSWTVTGPFATLKNRDYPQYSGDYGVKTWLAANVPAKKIVLGLPFYGYGWRLEDPNNPSPFPPADGPADGVLFAADGAILYKQIVFFENTNPPEFLPNYVVDIYRYGNTWIAYNDTPSITAKVRYAYEKKELLGYFAWHLGGDRP
ncbi:class V chitinase-like [Alnus glutinosa]|uniref:class V chitinase-like n=1 Tax=Alnus glutinosa TaxID=3517 RepID=UPI002D764FDB|nr:class V chitinase-like [Alnus glutinosa]